MRIDDYAFIELYQIMKFRKFWKEFYPEDTKEAWDWAVCFSNWKRTQLPD
jgi:hypothetical protein